MLAPSLFARFATVTECPNCGAIHGLAEGEALRCACGFGAPVAGCEFCGSAAGGGRFVPATEEVEARILWVAPDDPAERVPLCGGCAETARTWALE